MKKSYFLVCIFTCVAAFASMSLQAAAVTYAFTGTVTDAGNIAGISASVGDSITGSFTYDTSTPDSNTSDGTIGEYNSVTPPPLNITLPGGSITFDSDASVLLLTYQCSQHLLHHSKPLTSAC